MHWRTATHTSIHLSLFIRFPRNLARANHGFHAGLGGYPKIIQGPPISPGPPKLAILVYGARETEFRYQRTMKFDLNSRQLKTLNWVIETNHVPNIWTRRKKSYINVSVVRNFCDGKWFGSKYQRSPHCKWWSPQEARSPHWEEELENSPHDN